MKVCLDLVAGHSSTKCAWFKESSEKDPNQRYSDYYIWMNDIPESEKKEIEARHQEASPGLVPEADMWRRMLLVPSIMRRISSSASQP